MLFANQDFFKLQRHLTIPDGVSGTLFFQPFFSNLSYDWLEIRHPITFRFRTRAFRKLLRLSVYIESGVVIRIQELFPADTICLASLFNDNIGPSAPKPPPRICLSTPLSWNSAFRAQPTLPSGKTSRGNPREVPHRVAQLPPAWRRRNSVNH